MCLLLSVFRGGEGGSSLVSLHRVYATAGYTTNGNPSQRNLSADSIVGATFRSKTRAPYLFPVWSGRRTRAFVFIFRRDSQQLYRSLLRPASRITSSPEPATSVYVWYDKSRVFQRLCPPPPSPGHAGPRTTTTMTDRRGWRPRTRSTDRRRAARLWATMIIIVRPSLSPVCSSLGGFLSLNPMLKKKLRRFLHIRLDNRRFSLIFLPAGGRGHPRRIVDAVESLFVRAAQTHIAKKAEN